MDATVCQQLFAELLGKARIRFESGKSDIVADSAGLLDRRRAVLVVIDVQEAFRKAVSGFGDVAARTAIRTTG